MEKKLRAHRLAATVHDGQPYGEFPYIVHVTEVAWLIQEMGGTQDEVAAAFLHDSVEDTDLTIEDIETQFGQEVALMVLGLTHPEGQSYEDYMAAMPSYSQPIKFADSMRNLIHTMALPEDHPKRAKWLLKYARNVNALIDVLAQQNRWAQGMGKLYALDPEFHAAIDTAEALLS